MWKTRDKLHSYKLRIVSIHQKFRKRRGRGSSWPWSYGSWIYNYLCNPCLSSLMLWVWIAMIRARCITLCDKVCQWLETEWWVNPVSSTDKLIMHHTITDILLNASLYAIFRYPHNKLESSLCLFFSIITAQNTNYISIKPNIWRWTSCEYNN